MNYFQMLNQKSKLKKELIRSMLVVLAISAVVTTMPIFNLSIFSIIFNLVLVIVMSVIVFVVKVNKAIVPLLREYQSDIETMSGKQFVSMILSQIGVLVIMLVIYLILIILALIPSIISAIMGILSIILVMVFTVIYVYFAMLMEIAFVQYLQDRSTNIFIHYFKSFKENARLMGKEFAQYVLFLFLVSMAVGMVSGIIELIPSLPINLFFNTIIQFILSILVLYMSLTLYQLIFVKLNNVEVKLYTKPETNSINTSNNETASNDVDELFNLHDDM